jgi:hypothetical protein
LVVGIVVLVAGLGFFAGGATVLWADQAWRDGSGYVTTGAHTFSSAGSAVVTDPVELGSPGVAWFYSTTVLGRIQIQVTPQQPAAKVFVGIGPTGAVDQYLAGVGHTVVADFWSNTSEVVNGDATTGAPADQHFWVASATGQGSQTLTWGPANGSWTVVVMNADARPGVDVTAALGATMPTLGTLATVSFVAAVLLLVAGTVLVVGAIRRARSAGSGSVRPRTEVSAR